MKLDILYCDDNVRTMKTLPDECVDLTVTSPPYDHLRRYKGYSWDLDGTVRELFRLTKPGGVVVWVVGDAVVDGSETCTSFRHALRFREEGFRLHDTMIYAKANPLPHHSRNRYEQAFEFMFIFAKGRPTTAHIQRVPCKYAGMSTSARTRENSEEVLVGKRRIIKDTKPATNIWTYQVGHRRSTADPEALLHPAIFPERLAEDHILTWSNPGDVVLDPFVGSGTVAKLAALHGRRYIGIDISPEYIEIALKRVERVSSQPPRAG